MTVPTTPPVAGSTAEQALTTPALTSAEVRMIASEVVDALLNVRLVKLQRWLLGALVGLMGMAATGGGLYYAFTDLQASYEDLDKRFQEDHDILIVVHANLENVIEHEKKDH